MADKRIQYNERMTGAGHPTLPDTLNRLATVEHNTDGTHDLTKVAPASKGVTNGDLHDHSGGDGATLDHASLLNKGSNTHAQIDTALSRVANTSGTNTGDQDLSGYSLTSHNHSLNNLAEKSYNSLTDKPSIPSVSGLLDETAHDALDHTGLTGIPAAYSLPTASTTVLGGVKIDGTTILISDGVISSTGGVTDHGALTGLSDDDHSQYLNESRHDLLDHTGLTGVPTQYTDEMAQDAIGTLITNGTQTGITVAYDDANNKIDFTVTAAGAGDVTGPSSATDGNIALFDGITGKVIKNSTYSPTSFATALGTDDNYVTDAEKTKLANLSGINTGDQDLSGYSLTSHNHSLNNLAEKSYNSLTDKPSIPSITGLLDETTHDALDHTGLTGIPAAYSLPTASTTVLGGVKVDGTTVTITDGVISSSGSGMTNPMTAAGDIIIGGTSGTPTRLAKGTDGQVCTLVSGVPAWAAASGGGSSAVTVEGLLTICVTQQTTLTITNYDSATAYSVDAVAGSASITGDTITYTASSVAGTDTLTIAAGSSTRDITITVEPQANSYIATPTATPAIGSALDGGFYTGMIWNELVQSATSTAIGTGSKAFTVADMTSTPIVYAGQALEVRSRANPANKMIGTVTGAYGTTLTINVASVGGSGTFTDWSIMAKYRIIVAPKASGESTGKAYKAANTAAPTACQTLSEGFKATNAMVAAGDRATYPAAWFCSDLIIGGYTDWYLPARDELELCWRNLKPGTESNYSSADRPDNPINYTNLGSLDDVSAVHGTNLNSSPQGSAYTASAPAQTSITAFRTGGAEAFVYGANVYWSASEYSGTGAWKQDWYSSGPGLQNGGNKSSYSGFYVRAVRRSII